MVLLGSLIKFLFFILIFFVLFSIVRIVFFFMRNFKGGVKHFQSFDRTADEKKKSNDDKQKTIELDKDQYKVE